MQNDYYLNEEQVQQCIKEKEHARLAQEVLDNPLIKQWQEDLELELINGWKNSTDIRERDNIHIEMKIFERFKSDLINYIKNGAFVEQKLTLWQKMKDKMK